MAKASNPEPESAEAAKTWDYRLSHYYDPAPRVTAAARAAYAREYRATNKDKIAARQAERLAMRGGMIDYIKREYGCVDCGTKTGRLDFDHIEKDTKLFNISNAKAGSWAKIAAEIAKCEVRCASCHTRRHGRERVKKPDFIAAAARGWALRNGDE